MFASLLTPTVSPQLMGKLVFLPSAYYLPFFSFFCFLCSSVVNYSLDLLGPTYLEHFFLAKLDLSKQEYTEGLLDDTSTNVMAESFTT